MIPGRFRGYIGDNMNQSDIKSKAAGRELLDQLRSCIDDVVTRDRAEHREQPRSQPGAERELEAPFDYIKPSRRAVRLQQISEARTLLLTALERYPKEPHLLLEWSKFAEHRTKDYAQALEYAKKIPEEIEGASGRERRIARLQLRVRDRK